MFHPVGSQPPSVYWRRRFALLASLVVVAVLILLTLRVLLSSDPKSSSGAAGAGTSSSPRPASTPVTSPSRSTSTSARPTHAKSTASTSSTPTKSSSPAPKPCVAGSLTLAAVTNQTKYAVGNQPQLSIQVTNKGSVSCVVDLADPQIVMRVYNGESRVWGSHDCKVEPGVDDRTLMAGTSVRVSIVWSGLSSQPKCAGTRERVGAGTYTLYASLAGREAQAAQFTIS